MCPVSWLLSPTVPYHYGLHSLHLVSSAHDEQPQKMECSDQQHGVEARSAIDSPERCSSKAWLFYCKSKIDYTRGAAGTTLLALWERRHGGFASSGMQQEWQNRLRKWIQTKELAAQQVAQLLLENMVTNPTEPWAYLMRDYQGIFIISDRPNAVTVLCSPSHGGCLQFFASESPANEIR